MKVLHLSNGHPTYGGESIYVTNLVRELSQQIQVECRYFGEDNFTTKNLQQFGYLNHQKHQFQLDKGLNIPLSAMSTCLSFLTDPVDSDIVHCHTWYTLLAGVMIKRLYNIPLVITVHSMEKLRPWKQETLGRGYQLSSWLEEVAFQEADKLIVPSKQTYQDMLKFHKTPPEKLRIIWSGVDTDFYQYTNENAVLLKYGIDIKRPYVLFFGRTTKQKGIENMLAAIPYIDPTTQIVFCMGKHDHASYLKEIESKINLLQKQHSIIWLKNDWFEPEEIVQLFSHASVYCCPSIYETFGLVAVEAMACGTPVVATDIGGLNETIAHRKTGFLAPFEINSDFMTPKNQKKLARDIAEYINLLLGNKELRKQMSILCRQRAENYFSWKATATGTIDVYHELFNENKMEVICG